MTLQTDFIVIGGGPAGQKAAVQAAKLGRRVVLIEREAGIGGECVFRGTIPSKSLRQRAIDAWRNNRSLVAEGQTSISELLGEVNDIVLAHTQFMTRQLQRNGITVLHGQAAFVDANTVAVKSLAGGQTLVRAERLLIATGSIPRLPPEIPVDHEHIIDSDSILSMPYLPASLIVLGGGVIACEYASIFALLGVKVTMVDRNARPLTFMDDEIVDYFIADLQLQGGEFVGGTGVVSAQWDDFSHVEVTLSDGTIRTAEKVFCAMGRQARVADLELQNAGLAVNQRGYLDVSNVGQTAVPHIYAAGDVAGPPSLASASMEQGRRASRHAMGARAQTDAPLIPSGIYAVPELASIGPTESTSRATQDVLVGRAHFAEVARGQISGLQRGLLKLVADQHGNLLSVHVVGEGATELVHIGQLALLHGAHVDTFVDHVFNFPTMAEAYRVAALQIAGQLQQRYASDGIGAMDVIRIEDADSRAAEHADYARTSRSAAPDAVATLGLPGRI